MTHFARETSLDDLEIVAKFCDGKLQFEDIPPRLFEKEEGCTRCTFTLAIEYLRYLAETYKPEPPK